MDEKQVRMEEIGKQLRAKISSKIATSTFLAGFGFAVLSIQVSILWDSEHIPGLLFLSIGLMVASLFIYIMAVIQLDGLTMPKRFWKEDEKNYNPCASRLAYLTDEDIWELRKQMIFYWSRLTIVATVVMAISLFLILLPCSPQTFSINLIEQTCFWSLLSLFIAFGYFAIQYYYFAKKNFKPLLRNKD
ncbi:hypothetical protein BZZ01_04985 [Nostocales cyanobacterium HT-58-2]|nr:hypothetical protein BZZ01_04985 [Nostocales cyanobacterium HT-58-2]